MNKKLDSPEETLAVLVEEFLNTPSECCDDDEYYASLDSLDEAIRQAALALTATGSVSTHQRQGVRSETQATCATVVACSCPTY